MLLSEEEIIKNYNSLIINAKANWIYEDYEILLNFLNLYQKEKEKNIEYFAQIESLKYTTGNMKHIDIIRKDYISKDKIKAKIEEVDKRENVSIADVFESMKEYAIQVLQELLTEE